MRCSLLHVHAAGPDVEQYGHARIGDGQAISDVVGGKIHVRGAASGLAYGGPAHLMTHHVHHVHHTADGTAVDDPRREFVHDGTTYATGEFVGRGFCRFLLL